MRKPLPFDVHVVPAEPGWYTVLNCYDGSNEDPLVVGYPVLAWCLSVMPAIDQDSWEPPLVYTYPITHNGLEESQLWGYQDPRGKIHEANGISYDDLADATRIFKLAWDIEARNKKLIEEERIACVTAENVEQP